MKHLLFAIILTFAAGISQPADAETTTKLPTEAELSFLIEQAMSRVPRAMREAVAIEAYKQKKMALLRGPMQLELWMMEVRFDIALSSLTIIEKAKKKDSDELIFDVAYTVDTFGSCAKLPEAAAAFNALVASGGDKNKNGEARLYVKWVNSRWVLTSLQSKGSIDWVRYIRSSHDDRMALYPIPFEQYEKKMKKNKDQQE